MSLLFADGPSKASPWWRPYTTCRTPCKVALKAFRRLVGGEHQAQLVSAADKETEGSSERKLG